MTRRIAIAAALAAAWLWLATPVVATAADTSRDDSALAVDMARILREEGLTGATWALVAPGRATTTGAAGVRDARSGAPMHPDTHVQVGSVTKALLAIGVLRLAGEGRLALDAPIEPLLPGVRFDNPWQATDPLRVRHLLTHTAGLENLHLWQFLSLSATPDAPLPAAFPQHVQPLRVQARPGSRFGYSNLGYALLGQVIETATGERYERFLDRELLAPLSMHDSTFGFRTQSGDGADARLAMGHFEGGAAHPAVPMHLRPASQFTTTAGDMTRFARLLLDRGGIDGTRLIDPALMTGIARPNGTEAADAGLAIGHGGVLAGRDRHGLAGGCHSGNTVGFWAMLCVYPQHGKAFFLAVNADSEDADYERLVARLIAALGMPPDPEAGITAMPGDVSAWSGLYVRTPDAMPALAQVLALTGFLCVEPRADGLWLGTFPAGGRLLRPAGGHLFRAEGRRQPSHVLLTAEDGTRLLSDGLRSYARVPAWTLVLPWLSLASAALALAGVAVHAVWRALRGRLRPSDPRFPPALAIALLSSSLPFFLGQSLLQLGDVTVASVLLAVATPLLPVGLAVGVLRALRNWRTSRTDRRTAILQLLALQGFALPAVWGLLPLRLWAL